MLLNKTLQVSATSVAVKKSNYSRTETVKLVYHKPQKSIYSSINDDILTEKIVISGVDIINDKNYVSNKKQTNATDLAKVEATSLIKYESTSLL